MRGATLQSVLALVGLLSGAVALENTRSRVRRPRFGISGAAAVVSLAAAGYLGFALIDPSPFNVNVAVFLAATAVLLVVRGLVTRP